MTDSLDTKSLTERLMTPAGQIAALIRHPKAHADRRGSVRETYRASWFPEVPPIKQLVQSNSKPMTLRGMHLHRKQWDIWRFTSDDALVRLYDTSSGEQAFLRADKDVVLAIPPGISHGFFTERGCTLVYALTEEYTGDDEFGWYPFDDVNQGPENGGNTYLNGPFWPQQHDELHISERDLRAPRLADFKG